MADADDFYVGYQDRAPASLSAFLRPRVAALLIFGPLLLASVAVAQRGFIPSVFEFGTTREFVGWISESPVPALVVLRPGDASHCGATTRFPLVELGKFGARDAIAGLDGQPVRVRGTLIHLDDRSMIELAEDGIARIDDPGAAPGPREPARFESLGRRRFEGEIVDTKCHYRRDEPRRTARCIEAARHAASAAGSHRRCSWSDRRGGAPHVPARRRPVDRSLGQDASSTGSVDPWPIDR